MLVESAGLIMMLWLAFVSVIIPFTVLRSRSYRRASSEKFGFILLNFSIWSCVINPLSMVKILPWKWYQLQVGLYIFIFHFFIHLNSIIYIVDLSLAGERSFLCFFCHAITVLLIKLSICLTGQNNKIRINGKYTIIELLNNLIPLCSANAPILTDFCNVYIHPFIIGWFPLSSLQCLMKTFVIIECVHSCTCVIIV